MSGLLALLDDVAGIAKVAAASVDDVAAAASKAGAKAAGVVIDDAAVTPRYVTGLRPARELPMIWRIARGSFINKLVFLLPAALLMSAFAPWLIPPLLIMGGSYLCFEGAEKIAHLFFPHNAHHAEGAEVSDPEHLEESKVAGAIKTDFILSAEIMIIALSTIDNPSIWVQAGTLAVVGIGITIVVYGVVALIVKMDDIGLFLAEVGRMGITRAFGRWLVRIMPLVLKILSVVGTAAMLWVGGSLIIHSLHQMGWHMPEETIHDIAHNLGGGQPALDWGAKAVIDGVLGLLWGLVLIPIGKWIVAPLWSLLPGKRADGH